MTEGVAKLDQTEPDVPDLLQAVNAVISTFAVLVGISLTDFFDETKNQLGKDIRPWAFVALVALLLRYIMGSAIHLNRAYGKRKKPDGKELEGPLLPSTVLFVKDLAFLVAFGYVAIQITHSLEFKHFLREAAWFVGLGLAWSATDPFCRWWHLGQDGCIEELNRLAVDWIVIDAVQLALTILIHCRYTYDSGIRFPIVLMVLYVVFFCVDMAVLIGGRRVCEWPPLLK